MEEEAWERLGRKEEEEGVFIPTPPNLPVGLGGPRAPGVKGPGPRTIQRHWARGPGTRGSNTPGTRTDQGVYCIPRVPGGPRPRVRGIPRYSPTHETQT